MLSLDLQARFAHRITIACVRDVRKIERPKSKSAKHKIRSPNIANRKIRKKLKVVSEMFRIHNILNGSAFHDFKFVTILAKMMNARRYLSKENIKSSSSYNYNLHSNRQRND